MFEEDEALFDALSTTFINKAVGLTMSRDDLGEPSVETVNSVYDHCMNIMSNEHFSMNKNKCAFIKTTYGK